jgi:4-hydroxy-3-polyprenylbenzoate decarboxylase/2,5-furandicarboxylate decarboxylase 1
VEVGQCQEVVKTGKEANLHELPIPTFSDKDSGPYITLGVTVSKDPENGMGR